MENTKHDSYYKAIDSMLRQFNKAGFEIKFIECDGEYLAMMDNVCDGLGVTMNYTNAQDHEPRAERNNRTIKNGFRLAFHRTGYKAVPIVLMHELGMLIAERINMFPAKHGMSECFSPNAIMNKEQMDFNKHCKYSFGEFAQAHHQNNPTNTVEERIAD